MEIKYCPNCRKQIEYNKCSYCGCEYLDSYINSELDNIHELTCKEANLSFWTIAFPAIFAVSFTAVGFIAPLSFLINNSNLKDSDFFEVFGMISLFGLVGLGACFIIILRIVRNFLVDSRGQVYNGIVVGYENDNLYLNHRPAQVAIIKLDTEEGPRIIRYQLQDIRRPYQIGSMIMVKRYKNMFKIVK